jgi:hypothetical protein
MGRSSQSLGRDRRLSLTHSPYSTARHAQIQAAFLAKAAFLMPVKDCGEKRLCPIALQTTLNPPASHKKRSSLRTLLHHIKQLYWQKAIFICASRSQKQSST